MGLCLAKNARRRNGAPKSLDGQKRAARDDNGKLTGCLSQTLRLVHVNTAQ